MISPHTDRLNCRAGSVLCSYAGSRLFRHFRLDRCRIYYDKTCRTCGPSRALISTDEAFYRWQRESLKPGDGPPQLQSTTDFGCPCDCGLCPDHEQHSCLAIIEVNEACNLDCPVCFAGSFTKATGTRSLAEIERMI
jgi:uncharacterized radical SAM superfamily Fe-S cluster-containing enzyme